MKHLFNHNNNLVCWIRFLLSLQLRSTTHLSLILHASHSKAGHLLLCHCFLNFMTSITGAHILFKKTHHLCTSLDAWLPVSSSCPLMSTSAIFGGCLLSVCTSLGVLRITAAGALELETITVSVTLRVSFWEGISHVNWILSVSSLYAVVVQKNSRRNTG